MNVLPVLKGLFMEVPLLPAEPPVIPAAPVELPALDTDPASYCTIHSDSGVGVTVWSLPTSRLSSKVGLQCQLKLSPEAPVIIGRADGGEIEYLDPRYIPSPIMPGSGKTILKRNGAKEDVYVSRGHFMLRGHAHGVLLVNGVPRRGGGIRPPKNWTQLLAPENRILLPAEELVIERGAPVSIQLPNGTQLTIEAQ